MLRFNALLFVVAVLLLSGKSVAGIKSDTAVFNGEIRHKLKSDSVFILYHLTPYNFRADSVVLEVYGYRDNIKLDVNDFEDSSRSVVIYDRREGIPFENEWRRVFEKDEKQYFDGTIVVPLNGGNTEFWSVTVQGYYSNGTDTVQKLYTGESLSDNFLGLGMEIWSLSYGYYKSDHPAPFDKEGLFLGYGLAADVNFRHSRYSFSTSWSGLGKDFAFSEPFRFGYRRYLGDRTRFAPSLFGAVKLSKLKLKRDKAELYNLDWGLEAGVALDGPFERISYDYSSALGGYHTFELFLAFSGDAKSRVGTRYLLQRRDNLWMFRIAVHFDGLDALSEGKTLGRENNRPIIHKAFAFIGAIPYAIIAAPIYLVRKIEGKEN